ncbi:MAG: Uma2 family endonuclease [Thermomicrobiales bacterium]
MAAEPKSLISREAYLAMDRASDERHEYIAGEVFAMVGGTETHGLIIGNVLAALHRPTRQRGCRIYPGGIRIAIPAIDIYTFPDVSVMCGQPQYEDNRRDILLNPKVVVEVLSPSTERYDRGLKFQHYQHITSLDTYILIAQELPLVEQYVRHGEQEWLYSAASGLDASLLLPTLEYSLALNDVYDLVEFPRLTPHP